MDVSCEGTASLWSMRWTAAAGLTSSRRTAAATVQQRGAVAARSAGLSFRVLPRVADEQELRSLIDRVHKAHTLCGGRVHVHAPRSELGVRCKDCGHCGHTPQTCSQYGGLALRFLFKT